jgi:hypothetical protein
MTELDRLTMLGPLVLQTLSQITEEFLLFPHLPPQDSSALSTLFSPLLQLEGLFPRGRAPEGFAKYKVFPALLESDPQGILALWRMGRLKSVGWDAFDVIEILEKRFGTRNVEGIVREIRRR